MRTETRIKLFWLLAIAILTAIALSAEAHAQSRRTLNSLDAASRPRSKTATPKRPQDIDISSAIASTRRLLPDEKAAETVVTTGLSVAAQSCTLATQGSEQVFPPLSSQDFFNQRWANSVFSGEHFFGVDSGTVLTANFQDLLSVQLASALPLFECHVGRVIGFSAKKQMVGINASGNIALMKDAKPFRDVAIVDSPRKAVSKDVFSSVKAEPAVAKGSFPASPKPAAGFSLINKTPKATNRVVMPSVSTMGRAGRDGILAGIRGSAIKKDSTLHAFLDYLGTFGFFEGQVALTGTEAASIDAIGRDSESNATVFTNKRWTWYIKNSHFKSPTFDLVRDTEALARLSISLKAPPLYHVSDTPAQTSCTLQTAGYVGSPSPIGLGTVNLRWFTRTPPSQIQEFRIFAGWAVNVPTVGYFTAPGSALSYTVNYLCPVNGGAVTIQEIRTNGTVCSVAYTGNLPHGGCNGNGGGAGVSVVSAANYRGSVTRGAIVSVFPDPGVTFTSATETARVLPLPVSLGGVSVSVSGIPCGLFYVSPGQLNIQLPDSLPDGPTELSLTVTASDGRQLYGKPQVNPQAPGIFTVTGDGTGQAAAVWYGSGVVSLYATGIHSNRATLFLADGRQIDAQFVGDAPGYVGLQQLNFAVPRPSAALGAFVRVWAAGGYYDTQGFLLR